jgi:hypothetical protein
MAIDGAGLVVGGMEARGDLILDGRLYGGHMMG